MNLSGVLITTAQEAFDSVVNQANALPGVEIYQQDRASARAIAVIEADSTQGEVKIFERLKAPEGVLSVDLGNHCFMDEKAPAKPSHN